VNLERWVVAQVFYWGALWATVALLVLLGRIQIVVLQ